MRALSVWSFLGICAAALFSSVSSGHAGGDRPQKFCTSAAKDLKGDGDLAVAARAVFGQPGFTDNELDCLYPVQVIRYGDVDVLLSQNRAPEDGCQSCQTNLNATALKRIPGGYKGLRTFEAFGETGNRGSISAAWPVQIGGDDGLAIENYSSAQGYLFISLGLSCLPTSGPRRLGSKYFPYRV